MRAWCLIREQPCYRRDAFTAGLRARGYTVHLGTPTEARPGDLLITWNRYGTAHELATRFEAQGGTVLVAENAYLDPARHAHPHSGRQWYALALHAHNGRGEWFPGGAARWQSISTALGLELRPMIDQPQVETEREHLIAPNRPFGQPGGIMPADWPERLAAELRCTHPGARVRIRPHPGNAAPAVPLQADLANAAALHIWNSSAGIAALLHGVPVRCHAPWWIGKGWEVIGRDAMFQRLAWSQWHTEEIAAGEPFRHLLSGARQGEVAQAV